MVQPIGFTRACSTKRNTRCIAEAKGCVVDWRASQIERIGETCGLAPLLRLPCGAGPKPVHPVHRRTLMTVAAAVLVVGCETVKKESQASRLDQTLRAYAGSIRWGNYDTADAFAAPRAVAKAVQASSLDGIKVTGYEVRVNSVAEDAREASVHMNFSYYDEARGTVGSLDQDATWYWDDSRKNWLMDDSLPRFKR